MARLFSAIILFLAAPMAAQAQTYACLFETECYSQNGCEETEWEGLLEASDSGYVFQSQSDFDLQIIADNNDGLRLAGMSEEGNFITLSLFPDGSTISTTSFFYEAAQGISWYGRCEALN